MTYGKKYEKNNINIKLSVRWRVYNQFISILHERNFISENHVENNFLWHILDRIQMQFFDAQYNALITEFYTTFRDK